MDSKFTWKGEIQFAGTPEDFNALSAALDKLNISVVPDVAWPKPSWPGLLPMPVAELLGQKRVDDLAGLASLKAHIEFLRGIRGGIREAHLHLGDEVAFLDHESFKAYVSEVAQALAERRVDLVGNYIDVMAGLNPIASLPGPLP
jgi:hypothetical protein